MQAALMLGSKSRVAGGGKLRKGGGRLELPSNVATKEIAPFPRYPPESWGRAAWLERGRRCSVQEAQQQAAKLRWVKRNRIQDASLGGSSDDEDFLGVLRGPSTFANAFLYVGLGTIALGLVIAFVGTGEKGFKTVELRLIGPSLIGIGFVCCMLRILFCICPSHCISPSKNARKKKGNKIDADHTTSLLRGESKRVSIAREPGQQPRYPITHKRANSKMLNEGMEALRQIATTSLFMQNEQKPMTNRIVPIIKEPENLNDAPLEMKKLTESDSGHSNVFKANTAHVTELYATEQDTSVHAPLISPYPSSSKHHAAISEQLHDVATSTAVTKVSSARQQHGEPHHRTQRDKAESSTAAMTKSTSSSSKLSRQRKAMHQLQQHQTIVSIDEPDTRLKSSAAHAEQQQQQEQETSLIFVRNPKLDREMRPPMLGAIAVNAATSTSLMDSSIESATSPLILNQIASVHMPLSGNGIWKPTAQQQQQHQTTSSILDSTSTASTYAAALAAAASSRGHMERSESLIRGPLGTPLHVLTASTSTYGMPTPATAPSGSSITRSTTTSLLPPPATAPSLLLSAQQMQTTALTSLEPKTHLPGQISFDEACSSPSSLSAAQHHRFSIPMSGGNSPTSFGSSAGVVPTTFQQHFPDSNYCAATSQHLMKFPATSMLASAAYSGSYSSSTSTPSGHHTLIGSPSPIPFNGGAASIGTLPTTLPSKYEPELLLSPAKLGQ